VFGKRKANSVNIAWVSDCPIFREEESDEVKISVFGRELSGVLFSKKEHQNAKKENVVDFVQIDIRALCEKLRVFDVSEARDNVKGGVLKMKETPIF
jgi:hypothetical protein